MDISDKGSLSAKTLLLDQSNRIEQHRANFDALKGEYLKLQEVSAISHIFLKKSIIINADV